jgi:hypothetical protein
MEEATTKPTTPTTVRTPKGCATPPTDIIVNQRPTEVARSIALASGEGFPEVVTRMALSGFTRFTK